MEGKVWQENCDNRTAAYVPQHTSFFLQMKANIVQISFERKKCSLTTSQGRTTIWVMLTTTAVQQKSPWMRTPHANPSNMTERLAKIAVAAAPKGTAATGMRMDGG